MLRRALPAGIVCVQNAYSLVGRDHEEMLALCAAEDGSRSTVELALVDVAPGDRVLVHAGVALTELSA